METIEILNKVKSGELTVEEAERFFKKQPFEELGFAKLDSHREIRSGFPEVIFCSKKQDDFLVNIYQKMFNMPYFIMTYTLITSYTIGKK